MLEPMEHKLREHRQQFLALSHHRYFNYGGQGPLPQAALTAMVNAYHHLQAIGPFSGQANDWVTQQTAKTRGAIAQLLGVSVETIAFTDSVSGGCNIALWGVNWQAGDRLLITDCEHPSVIAIGQQLQRRFGVELDRCSIQATVNDGDPISAICEALTPRTRMVAMSHVHWNTGQVLPLAALVSQVRATQPEILILVDAAQSVGVLPLNLATLDVDCYAFTGHKWCCGPDGLGGLYIHPRALEQLEPTYVGWRSGPHNAQGNMTRWHSDSRRYEVATSAFPLFCSLEMALALHGQWGSTEQRYQRIVSLSQRLWTGLQSLKRVQPIQSQSPSAGLVSFQVTGGHHGQVVQQLEAAGILVRQIQDPDCIRASLHYLTLESEIDFLLEQLQTICG